MRDSQSLESIPKLPLGKLFQLEFQSVRTEEPLLCDLEEMVRRKSLSAYQAVRVPCIVEHAGLILSDYEAQSFPGGLTQPMWDAINAEAFLRSCHPLSKRAIARAVIGYCDGFSIQTFVGDTAGQLADKPRGSRAFYWDTVFCPDGGGGKTYAEIAEGGKEGLKEKLALSQSVKALKRFMEYRIQHEPVLFPTL